MLTQDELNQIRGVVREETEPLKKGQEAIQKDQEQRFTEVTKRLDRIGDDVSHTNTILKLLPPRGEVEEIVDTAVNAAKNEINANILNLDAKMSRKTRSLERRVSNIEEHEGIENPDKN